MSKYKYKRKDICKSEESLEHSTTPSHHATRSESAWATASAADNIFYHVKDAYDDLKEKMQVQSSNDIQYTTVDLLL